MAFAPLALIASTWAAPVAIAVMPTRSGNIPPPVVQGYDAGLFAIPARPQRLATSAIQAVWNIPVILCSFSDQPLGAANYGSQTPAQYFQTQLFDTTSSTPSGSVFDYYRWVSGNRIRVVGRVVATIQLPNPKDWYAAQNWGLSLNGRPRNSSGFVSDAVVRADSLVDWTLFDNDRDGYVDVVWVVHSGLPGEATVARDNLWSITSRLTAWPGGERYPTHSIVPGTEDLHILIDRFSIMPELSGTWPGRPSEIGVYCHEFGHTLGLPDLYDASVIGGAVNVGSGHWNLMAMGAYGGDGFTPESPTHLGAWCTLFMGWGNTVRPTQDTLIVQGAIARGAPIVDFWFQGESNPEHFLIEYRRAVDFDRFIPREGLIVYQVDESVMGLGIAGNRVNSGPNPGLRVVESDGQYDMVAGRNRGDVHDPFPGFYGITRFDDDTQPSTRTFRGAVTNIGLSQIELLGSEARYFAQVRAPGWLPAQPIADDFQAVWPSSAANRAVLLADGSIATVTTEFVAGSTQVVLRSRPAAGAWGPPVTIGGDGAPVSNPTMAALPGGNDLVVAWSDARHGAAELYYRARIGGAWTPERRLTDLDGDSRSPSLGVDRFGRVHLAWLHTEGATPQVRFMSFGYFSPFGTPRVVTGPTSVPDAPVVAVDAAGRSYVFWADRSFDPTSIWFARFHPDSGVSAPARVARSDYAQPAVDAAVDAAGTVHIAWQVSAPGIHRIHYQRRTANGAFPSPYDTALVVRGENVLNPILRLDPGGGIHVGFLANQGGVQQMRYKHWVAGRGWDYASTEITLAADGLVARPTLVPRGSSDVSAIFIGFPGGRTALLERRRFIASEAVAVFDPPREIVRGLRIGPNPLAAGAALTLRWPAGGTPPSAVDFYDVAGRRVASASLSDRGAGTTELPGSTTAGWKSGVYFAHLRGRPEPPARLVVIR